MRKTSEFFHLEPNSQKEILSVPKMKMREKSKLETMEEFPLEEQESQVKVGG